VSEKLVSCLYLTWGFGHFLIVSLKKLTKEEQIATCSAFGEAIRHEIESHSVQITCLSGDALVDAGSGVSVSIAHRHFVFTAAHVVSFILLKSCGFCHGRAVRWRKGSNL
jgi:hypothetical protein